LRDYLGRLHDQRASLAPPVLGSAASCPADTSAFRSVLVDGRGPGLVRAVACSYPLRGGPIPRYIGDLSAHQVQQLNADLAAHATRQPSTSLAVRLCQSMYGTATVIWIAGVNAWGDRIELSDHCSVYTFMDRDGTWYWTPSPHISAMLDSILKGIHHPTGRISGRLLAVGGPAGSSPRPLSGEVRWTKGPHGAIAVGPDGRFRVRVQPGRYRLVGHSPSYLSGRGGCQPLRPFVTVTAHRITHVDVLCQER
jgi:hypothetical protein